MTGDDHAQRRHGGRFDAVQALQPGRLLGRQLGVRPRHVLRLPGTPLTNAQAAATRPQGFEVGLHVNTDCADCTPASLEANFADAARRRSRAKYPSLAPPSTNRTHCIAWSDWVTQPKVELDHGIRLDTNYYYWPAGWVQRRPGLFTGSGMPMRFADLDGTMIDVYQATTQMTDESGQTLPVHDRHAARPRARRRGLLRRVHREHAHRRRRATPASDAIVAVGAGARRARRLGAADADLARRPQRLVVRARSAGTARR